ncbi:unnamed protein product [Cylicostephanus goldi]|uniref:F-box domain-containing protein n=1 Tax=Cylicostephanus goldi TaxID=71465 RepID=A0A3P7MWT4_CYLGO|nr:unnamed protein product [Cylicostephanus goldi]
MGEVQDEDEDGMLLRLPNELLLLIFTHVRGRHLVNNVRLVCKKFRRLLDNQQWWLSRIHRMPQNIRLSESHMKADDFNAAQSFVAIEEETCRWTRWMPGRNLIASGHIATVDALRLFAHRASSSRFCLSGGRDRAIKLWNIGDLQIYIYRLRSSLIASGHIATVDALRLFAHRASSSRFCLSGGRDRAIKLWNIGDLQESQISSEATKPSADIQNAHEGWIWCLDQSARSPDQFLSCSWDCTVKLWQITPASVEPLVSTKLGSAGMCLSNSADGLAACSTFGKKVGKFC